MRLSALVSAAVLAAAIAVPAWAQTAPEPSRPTVTRPDSEQWDITSKITGRTYRIYVARPLAMAPPPPGGYPVVYMTDGDGTFHTAADALLLRNLGNEAKPAIVVGVGYGKGVPTAMMLRNADLTPTQADAATVATFANAGMGAAKYGEAEGFYRFLTEELRPQIDAAYKTDKSDNTLWGDSLGGLFGLHVLFNHPESFKTFLIGSPSIWWNDRAVLKDEAKLAPALAAGKVAPRVLITVGGLEESVAADAVMPPGMTREQVEGMMKSSAMVTNAVGLAGRLKALKGPAGYKVESVVFDGETHLSVIPAAIGRGMGFALKP